MLRSLEHGSLLRSVAIDHDGSLIASATGDGTLAVWDVTTSSLLSELSYAASSDTGEIAFSGDGGLLLSGQGRMAAVWQIELESRSPDEVAAFVRCHAPYRLVETRLEPATPFCKPSLARAMR